MADKNDEGKDEVAEVQPDKDGKYPETVSWKQYVGTKESLGKKLATEREKVKSLEESLAKAVKPEDHDRIKQELDKEKEAHKKTAESLKVISEKSLSEKREILKSKGIPEDEIKNMTEEALNAAVKVLGLSKPKPDLSGGGGGSNKLSGSPLALAKQAYTK